MLAAANISIDDEIVLYSSVSSDTAQDIHRFDSSESSLLHPGGHIFHLENIGDNARLKAFEISPGSEDVRIASHSQSDDQNGELSPQNSSRPARGSRNKTNGHGIQANQPSQSHGLSTSAKVEIVLGSIIALLLVLCTWCAWERLIRLKDFILSRGTPISPFPRL